MSWSVSIHRAKDKEAALSQLQERLEPQAAHYPEWLPYLLGKIIEELPECDRSVINISSNGHFHQSDTGGRGTSNITINVSNSFEELVV